MRIRDHRNSHRAPGLANAPQFPEATSETRLPNTNSGISVTPPASATSSVHSSTPVIVGPSATIPPVNLQLGATLAQTRGEIRKYQSKIRGVDLQLVWYESVGSTPLNCPEPCPADPGTLFVHKHRESLEPQIWVMGMDASWISAIVGDSHPLLSKHRLHVSASGLPRWVTRKTVTTYMGRKKRITVSSLYFIWLFIAFLTTAVTRDSHNWPKRQNISNMSVSSVSSASSSCAPQIDRCLFGIAWFDSRAQITGYVLCSSVMLLLFISQTSVSPLLDRLGTLSPFAAHPTLIPSGTLDILTATITIANFVTFSLRSLPTLELIRSVFEIHCCECSCGPLIDVSI